MYNFICFGINDNKTDMSAKEGLQSDHRCERKDLFAKCKV